MWFLQNGFPWFFIADFGQELKQNPFECNFYRNKDIVFSSEANFYKRNAYKLTQSHGLRFFTSLLSSLPQPIFYLMLDAGGVGAAVGFEKLRFGENFLPLPPRLWRIAGKLENAVCDRCNPYFFSFVPEICLFNYDLF